MSLIFAAIAPHGGLAIAEACTPAERPLAAATRAGMEELGRLFSAARPEAVVIATPHNVHISGAIGVLIAGRVAGRLAGAPDSVALDVPCDIGLAILLLESLASARVPAVGVSFGSNDAVGSIGTGGAVAPMDWGALIPLWFMGGRQVPPVPVVVVTPARDLSAEAHVRAGAAIADAAASTGRRVAFIASADHGHAHRADGPYGYHPDARAYDRAVCSLVRHNRLDGLCDFGVEFVERAKADSWWQMLILHGATGAGWRGRLISYEAPTYFGMLTAAYRPAAVKPARPPAAPNTSSPLRKRTPPRTRGR